VKAGNIEALPLSINQTAKVRLHPYHRFDVGNGSGVDVNLTVTGGLYGLIVDARGRPVQVPAEPKQRAETYRRWQSGLDT
jgi:hypothetical protein